MDANIGDPRLAPSVERAYETLPLPGFWEQVTLRGMVVSAVLAILFCAITLRIHMTIGFVPAFNMPTTVVSYFFLKWAFSLIRSCGMAKLPFTRQENIFVLTAVNGAVNVALTGGFATCVIAMSTPVANEIADHANKADIVDNVDIWRYMIFLLLISLPAIMCTIPMTEIMLIDYKLLFPTGAVQADLINSFHTPAGAYIAKLQIATLLKTLTGSFSWTTFQWFYSAGDNCGFGSFPTFGMKLFERKLNFDFSAMYLGLGMLCPYVVNLTLLVGSIISFGLLYPYIETKRGEWYHDTSSTSLSGLNGYKVFLGTTMVLTDGLFNFLTLIVTTLIDLHNRKSEEDSGMIQHISKQSSLSYDDRKRIQHFLSFHIPYSLPVAAYIICATFSAVYIPSIFNQIKFYHVAALYIASPVLCFCNGYGVGLTDWSVAFTYAKFAVFVMAAWIGQPGAVVGGLVSCAIVLAVIHISTMALIDFKTAYMTLTSPNVMLTGQIFGIIIGSIINPCIFYAFKETVKNSIQVGAAKSEYPCPAAGIYRAIGVVGMAGVEQLPKHSLTFCAVASAITVTVDSLTFLAQRKGWNIQKYAPSMTALAMPFFYGGTSAIAMCLGSAFLYVWDKMDSQSAYLLSPVVAAGLIGGEGLFSLPTAVLSMNNVEPPICMRFLPSGKELGEVDSFLSSMSSTKP